MHAHNMNQSISNHSLYSQIKPKPRYSHYMFTKFIELSLSTVRVQKWIRLSPSTVCAHKPYPHNSSHIFSAKDVDQRHVNLQFFLSGLDVQKADDIFEHHFLLDSINISHKNLIQFRSDHACRETGTRISLWDALDLLTPATQSLFCHRLLHHFPTKIYCHKSIVIVQGVHVSYNFIVNMFVHGTVLILKSNEATANAVYDKAKWTWRSVDHNKCRHLMIKWDWVTYIPENVHCVGYGFRRLKWGLTVSNWWFTAFV